MIEISVVIPVYNEQDNVTTLYSLLSETLVKQGVSYEIVFVDDGSNDNTFKQIKSICVVDQKVKVIKLSRNFGQSAALAAGFDNSCGKIVATLDGDLQHHPKDIPCLLEKLKEGYGMVSGWRRKRKDNFLFRRLPSLIANKIIRFMFNVNLHDFGTTLRVCKREVLNDLELFGELHRFIPVLISWQGVKVAEVAIESASRKSGKSSYGISRTLRVILDLVTVKFLCSYITRPLYFFGAVGMMFFSIGFLVAGLVAIGYYFFDLQINENLGNLIFSLMMIMLGFQLIAIGLSMEISARIYHHTGKRKIYRIEKEYS